MRSGLDASRFAGRFLAIDGPDGAGKTTQVADIAAELRAVGLSVTTVREPGGTAVGNGIRELLLHLPDVKSRPVPYCELLLFMAARAQLVAEVIDPAIARGETVLTDRYVWSTLAYQVANGAAESDVLTTARGAMAGRWPDATVILDVPPEVGLSRVIKSRGGMRDAIEQRSNEYHARVRELFVSLPGRFEMPIRIVDGTADREVVRVRITAAITDMLAAC
ncbi:MAG: dTMP kinase [Phycisphaerales bacterium]|nr:dTMP kinase [Phycisphaerales bacterium]